MTVEVSGPTENNQETPQVFRLSRQSLNETSSPAPASHMHETGGLVNGALSNAVDPRHASGASSQGLTVSRPSLAARNRVLGARPRNPRAGP